MQGMNPPAKLPAYGKQLLRSRRAGVHPAVVAVVYGESWDVPGAQFRLAVKPGDALGRDWRCVAGLPVTVIDRDPLTDFAEECELFLLLAQIASEAAWVNLHTPAPLTRALLPENDTCVVPAHLYAFLCRRYDPTLRRMVWPSWWSDEIDKLNGRNRQRWLKEAETYLARFAA